MKTFKYVWNSNWILPYESSWSILEKFKYLNGFNNNNLIKIFKGRNSNGNAIECRDLQIFRQSSFDCKSFIDFFEICDNHFQLLQPMYTNKLIDYLHQDLYVCLKCIKYGYHSFFHQLIFTDECFIHKIKLKNITTEYKSVKYLIKFNNIYAYRNQEERKSPEIYIDIMKAPSLINEEITTLVNQINKINLKIELIKIFNLNKNEKIKYSSELSKMIKHIFFEDKIPSKPILRLSTDEIKQKYNDYKKEYEKDLQMKFYDHNRYKIILYACMKVIENIIKNYDENYILKIKNELNAHIPIQQEDIRLATDLIFAYNVSDSRDIYDSTGMHLLLHPYSHNVVHNSLELEFLCNEIIDYNDKYLFYINIFIYEKTLFNIYDQIKNQLQFDIDIKLEKVFNFKFSNYVVIKDRDEIYNIYEFI